MTNEEWANKYYDPSMPDELAAAQMVSQTEKQAKPPETGLVKMYRSMKEESVWKFAAELRLLRAAFEKKDDGAPGAVADLGTEKCLALCEQLIQDGVEASKKP